MWLAFFQAAWLPERCPCLWTRGSLEGLMHIYLSSLNQDYDLLPLKSLYCSLPRGREAQASCSSWLCTCWNNRPQGKKASFRRKKKKACSFYPPHIPHNYHLWKTLLNLCASLALLQSRKHHSKRQVLFWRPSALLQTTAWDIDWDSVHYTCTLWK